MKQNLIKKWVAIIISIAISIVALYTASLPILFLFLLFVEQFNSYILNTVAILLPLFFAIYNFYKASRQPLQLLIEKNLVDNPSLFEEIDTSKVQIDETDEKIRRAFSKVNSRDFFIPNVKIFRIRENIFNAFAISNHKDNAIVVYDGLVLNSTNEELRAVIGHELCHIKNKDSLYKILLFSTQFSIAYFKNASDNIFASLHNFLLNFKNFFVSISTLVFYYCLKVLFVGIDIALYLNKFIVYYTFKQNEYLADYHGATCSTYKGMNDVLVKIQTFEENNDGSKHQSLLFALLTEHPKTSDRILNLSNFFNK